MSADGDITACPGASAVVSDQRRVSAPQTDSSEKNVEKTKKLRKVSFPDEETLVTQYFEPANPWQDVPTTTRSQLAAEYLEACRIHNTPPIDAVLQQIRDLPENSIGGSTRAPRLVLTECALLGNAAADALEALLSKVQFRRVEIDSVEMDDEGAEAIFDMLEYYESAAAVCISGPRQFGIRGWQAASRMIKKSAELLELEISESPLEGGHASVLARSLRPLACRLRSLCLQQAQLTGEPLLNLVIALKSNSSVRELRLGDNRLTANDASQLGLLLRYNTRIQLLDLSNNQIQDAGVAHLADALVNQAAQTPPSAAASPLSPHHVPLAGYDTRGLAFLVLWNNQLTWNCAQSLAKVLRSSQSLCVLNIGRNSLGAEAVRALVCGGGPVGGALVSLGLQAARLGQDAGRLLADLIRADTRLQRLDLRDNKLGVEGLQAICVAMKENTTLTQIDLDEPTDSATSLSRQARAVREIRALCRRNEPAAPAAPARLLRKISLTCHTAIATLPKSCPSAEEERRTRLRSPAPSPAPSPAGSPVPAPHSPAPHSPSPHSPSPHSHSRFYVTRVTPERDSSTDSSCSSPSTPTRPACSPSPSRFKVVQVAEPPKIQVHPASQSRKASSRFSVTRNYDSMYNPTVTPVAPRPDSAMSDPGVTSVTSVKGDDTLASTPDSVKTDSEIGITRFTTQPVVGSTPINVARFIVSKPDFDPLKSKGDKQTEEVKKEKVEVEQLANVTEKLTNVTEKLSNVPDTIGNVTEKLTNVTEKLTDVSEKLSNVPHNVPNVLEKVTNAPDDKTHVPENMVSTSTHSINVPHSLINASHELSYVPVSENFTDLPTISGNAPQKVNNSRFTICKPDFNSVIEIVERMKTLPEKVDKVSSKENIALVLEVKYKDGSECMKVDTLPVDKIKSKDDEAVKGDSIRNSEKMSTLDSNKTQSNETMIVGKAHRVFHVQPVTSPPRIDTDSIGSRIKNVTVDDETKVEAPSIKSDIATQESKNFYSETIANPDSKKFEIENTSICLKDPINKDITLKKDVSIEKSSDGDKNLKSNKFEKEISKDGVSTSLETKKIEADAAISLKDSIEKDTALIKDKDDTKKLEVIREVIIPPEEESSEKLIIVRAKDVKDKKLEITEVPVPVIIMKEEDVKTNTKINIETDNKFTPVASTIEPVIAMHRDEVESDKITSIDSSSTQIVSDVKKSDTLVSKDKNTANTETDSEAKSDNKCDVCDGKTDHSVTDKVLSDIENVVSVTDTGKTVELDRVKNSVPKSDDHTVCDKDSGCYKDKMEELSHNETVVSVGDDKVLKTETKLVKSSVGVSEMERVDVNVAVTVNKETLCNNAAKVRSDQIVDSVNKNSEVKLDDRVRSSVGDVCVEKVGKKDGAVIKQIEAITEDLGNIIQEMQDLPCKVKSLKNDSTQTDNCITYKVPGSVKESVLKKNRSESSLDSPDLEVSRLMKRKPDSAFCDSSSSLEISGSSMESLYEIRKPIPEAVEMERRRESYIASAESSIESSDVTPVNLLNLSVSSNESVSPIIFGGKKLHGSLSSLEASVSSLESRHEKMVTSADSGIEYSLQNPSENKDDPSSNEGTLTHNSSLKESVRKEGNETLTSPKRTSSLLDVPAIKTKGLDRMRKISWVAPSASFHVPKPEPDRVEIKLQSNLEKLLSLFQHPSSLFSRSQSDEEKKSAFNTPPRKDSSLTSSFWSWGSSTDKSEKDDKEDRDSLSEATDSTLSCERVQVSYVDESFSKKLDSKTPSTDTDNTLSEFQSFQNEPERDRDTECRETERERNDSVDKVTTTTDDNLVQKSLVLSVKSVTSEGNMPEACDNIDLIMPNDLNRNVYDAPACAKEVLEVKLEEKDLVRPRTFAAVLKSGTENLEKSSPEGQPVDKLPSKVIRDIIENISPENTIFTSLDAKPVWETEPKADGAKAQIELAPIATIDETCDEAADSCIQLAFIDDVKIVDDERIVEPLYEKTDKSLETVDLGKDALSYLMYENQDFEPETEHLISNVKSQESLAQELKDAENKELLDLSPELILDDALELPVFTMDLKGMITSIPERAKKKSNSLEDLSQREEEKDSPKTKTIAFKVPESTSPRDIPERRTKLRSRSGSSPKSLPESLNKPSPISKMDTILSKKKKKVSSLGKIARDSLLALNMSEEEIAEFRRSYKLTSVESLKSLESVSEDANSQSGTSYDSRCRACLRLSQESLMSLDSITEDCRCLEDCDKRTGQSNR